MYIMKESIIEKIKKYGTGRNLSIKTGYTEPYISQILNRKKSIPKKAAYIITKMISNELEIDDVFEIRRNIKGELQCINFEEEKKENK